MSTTGQILDVAWILVCAALVMLMQAGFSCLESGLVRTKNSINVAAKNFADFCLSSALFWLFGFALMFGVTSGGWIGTSGFLFGDTAKPWLMAFFIFQLGFCGTATTIVSGAVAERMRFGGYLVVAAIISAVIYPVIGHWVWGSAAGASAGGWLEQMGFIDFAGSTVVHSVGGWIALAAIIIIGPRSGRFGKNAVPIHGHDLPIVTLGVFLLWFGWFGFNGGSTLALTPEVPTIIVNTTISGAFGGLVALALAWRLGGRPDVAMIMNGSLAGLVGITASAHIMTPLAAVAIGSIAAVVMYAVAMLLDRFEIDDVVGAVPVHLAAGVWGTLAVAIFADSEARGTGLGRWEQLGVQATGVGAGFAWAFGVGFALLWLINRWFPLRIDPEGERVGLNVAEHGASTEILDLLTEMDDQRRAGDFSQPVSVEPHTEIGQIAQQYNRVLADINAEQRQREAVTEALRQQTESLQLLREAAAAANRAKSVEEAIRTCLESICEFGGWSVGHCFMVDEAVKKLISTKIWHLDDEEGYAVFREVTEKTELLSGIGLCSLVLGSGKPNWIADVSADKNFSRAAAAKDVEIKGGAAFPVLVGDDVVAVLEFFSSEPKAPDETVSEVMGAVGTQLGRVVERERSSAARFKSVVDNLPAHVHLRDRSGRFILVNRQYEEFYGVTNDSVRGKTLHEVALRVGSGFAPDENAAFDEQVIKEDRIHELEFDVMREGGLRTLSDVKFPIKDHSGEIIAVGGIEVDITDRKRAEDNLQKSREQLQALADNLPEFISMKDSDGKFIFVNKQFEEWVCQSRDDVVGKTVHDIYSEEQATEFDALDRQAMDGRQILSQEVDLAYPDGETRTIIRTRFPVISSQGEVLGLGTVNRDITERKRAEEALQKAYGIIKDQRDRMEDELNIGREIQMSMVPLVFPPFPDHGEFSVFAALEPAREVGGDFYDYYFIDEERFCFCIGDVSGKGVPAALFMAMAKTLIKSRAADDRSTASILTHVNDELSVDNNNCMFVTIFSGILNIRTGELLYTNAGHNPPYLKRKDGALRPLDQRHGPIIGAVEGIVYAEGRDTLEPGDLLLLYTDGVTEAMDVDDRLFSENRLAQMLASMDTDDAEKVVDNTVVAVKAFEGEAEQTDDITVLALAFHGSPADALMAERRIVIRSHLPEIATVIEKFETFAEEFGVPRPIAMKFNLMFDDLLNNVISYAYQDDDVHDIEVRMELAGERLIVTITDGGVPFNPLSVVTPRTDLALEDREAGGLGIHLVRNLVDDVSYQRRIDKNVLTLMSHLQQKDSAA
jgi:ammonium transporter